jgi:hypothetical protein
VCCRTAPHCVPQRPGTRGFHLLFNLDPHGASVRYRTHTPLERLSCSDGSRSATSPYRESAFLAGDRQGEGATRGSHPIWIQFRRSPEALSGPIEIQLGPVASDAFAADDLPGPVVRSSSSRIKAAGTLLLSIARRRAVAARSAIRDSARSAEWPGRSHECFIGAGSMRSARKSARLWPRIPDGKGSSGWPSCTGFSRIACLLIDPPLTFRGWKCSQVSLPTVCSAPNTR